MDLGPQASSNKQLDMKEIIGYILFISRWWYPDKKTQTTITTERYNYD